MKLTRYLLRATRDGKYGDSMERVMLNTVLGALPLKPDGSSFYHSDYNFEGKRVYSNVVWPCCSGTLPQVVADYGINTYLREPGAVWVNLYQPSKLRWTEAGVPVALEQTSDFLGSSHTDQTVRLRITSASPASFALRLRIPAWAGPNTILKMNQKPIDFATRTGLPPSTAPGAAAIRLSFACPCRFASKPLLQTEALRIQTLWHCSSARWSSSRCAGHQTSGRLKSVAMLSSTQNAPAPRSGASTPTANPAAWCRSPKWATPHTQLMSLRSERAMTYSSRAMTYSLREMNPVAR